MEPDRWRRLEDDFNAALALPAERRAAFVGRITDPLLREELTSLLGASEAASSFLEQPARSQAPDPESAHLLEAGARLGAWRIVRLVGHGGMGEVYEVDRADGEFEQRAALKLLRRVANEWLDRFNTERQILARLEHPGIARLLDGGMAPDGRPYAVMEYVDGRTITEYCDERKMGLEARLALFLQVCDAVAFAHRNLIVHRDIKPGNVLVGPDDRTRLLDFGIAKPLDAGLPLAEGTGHTAALLTPDYAAPEQLAGEPITTATDVYALGVVLFELLVGRRPWSAEGRSFAQVVSSVLGASAPRASEVAEAMKDSRVAARRLRGDLDAIIAKCLRREPQHRYQTVNALKLDIERSIEGDPVFARSDARLYVFGRFMRRYRWVAAALVALIGILSAGVVATAWQAERASREAGRAAATRDFLISVFRESDPQIARDRPAGAITAKELLDQSVERISTEFADDPETLLELLDVASQIYGYWLDEARFAELLERRKELAETHFGPTHPVVIESLLIDAWGSIYAQDYAAADERLAEAERRIHEGGYEHSLQHAEWWVAKAEALKAGSPIERLRALDRAVELFAETAPEDAYHAIALANSAVAYYGRESYAEARRRNEQAIAVFLKAADRSDADLGMTYANLARSLQQLGELDAAERAYEQFAQLVRQTHGERHGSYWQGAADHARFVHLRGDRERAQRMFAALLAAIPEDWVTTTDDVVAREYYAERLAAEGRAAEAIPFLEAAESSYVERPMREHDLRRARQTLGDAYDRVGRSAEARRMLEAAREERMSKDAADSNAVLGARERWGRFLLSQGETAAAVAELREIVTVARDRASAPLALAHADLARAAAERGNAAGAVEESGAAVAVLERVVGLYDVRIEPQIWRTHAASLALAGDAEQAAAWNARALEASRRYDDPASPTVSAAAN